VGTVRTWAVHISADDDVIVAFSSKRRDHVGEVVSERRHGGHPWWPVDVKHGVGERRRRADSNDLQLTGRRTELVGKPMPADDDGFPMNNRHTAAARWAVRVGVGTQRSWHVKSSVIRR